MGRDVRRGVGWPAGRVRLGMAVASALALGVGVGFAQEGVEIPVEVWEQTRYRVDLVGDNLEPRVRRVAVGPDGTPLREGRTVVLEDVALSDLPPEVRTYLEGRFKLKVLRHMNDRGLSRTNARFRRGWTVNVIQPAHDRTPGMDRLREAMLDPAISEALRLRVVEAIAMGKTIDRAQVDLVLETRTQPGESSGYWAGSRLHVRSGAEHGSGACPTAKTALVDLSGGTFMADPVRQVVLVPVENTGVRHGYDFSSLDRMGAVIPHEFGHTLAALRRAIIPDGGGHYGFQSYRGALPVNEAFAHFMAVTTDAEGARTDWTAWGEHRQALLKGYDEVGSRSSDGTHSTGDMRAGEGEAISARQQFQLREAEAMFRTEAVLANVLTEFERAVDRVAVPDGMGRTLRGREVVLDVLRLTAPIEAARLPSAAEPVPIGDWSEFRSGVERWFPEVAQELFVAEEAATLGARRDLGSARVRFEAIDVVERAERDARGRYRNGESEAKVEAVRKQVLAELEAVSRGAWTVRPGADPRSLPELVRERNAALVRETQKQIQALRSRYGRELSKSFETATGEAQTQLAREIGWNFRARHALLERLIGGKLAGVDLAPGEANRRGFRGLPTDEAQKRAAEAMRSGLERQWGEFVDLARQRGLRADTVPTDFESVLRERGRAELIYPEARGPARPAGSEPATRMPRPGRQAPTPGPGRGAPTASGPGSGAAGGGTGEASGGPGRPETSSGGAPGEGAAPGTQGRPSPVASEPAPEAAPRNAEGRIARARAQVAELRTRLTEAVRIRLEEELARQPRNPGEPPSRGARAARFARGQLDFFVTAYLMTLVRLASDNPTLSTSEILATAASQVFSPEAIGGLALFMGADLGAQAAMRKALGGALQRAFGSALAEVGLRKAGTAIGGAGNVVGLVVSSVGLETWKTWREETAEEGRLARIRSRLRESRARAATEASARYLATTKGDLLLEALDPVRTDYQVLLAEAAAMVVASAAVGATGQGYLIPAAAMAAAAAAADVVHRIQLHRFSPLEERNGLRAEADEALGEPDLPRAEAPASAGEGLLRVHRASDEIGARTALAALRGRTLVTRTRSNLELLTAAAHEARGRALELAVHAWGHQRYFAEQRELAGMLATGSERRRQLSADWMMLPRGFREYPLNSDEIRDWNQVTLEYRRQVQGYTGDPRRGPQLRFPDLVAPAIGSWHLLLAATEGERMPRADAWLAGSRQEDLARKIWLLRHRTEAALDAARGLRVRADNRVDARIAQLGGSGSQMPGLLDAIEAVRVSADEEVGSLLGTFDMVLEGLRIRLDPARLVEAARFAWWQALLPWRRLADRFPEDDRAWIERADPADMGALLGQMGFEGIQASHLRDAPGPGPGR